MLISSSLDVLEPLILYSSVFPEKNTKISDLDRIRKRYRLCFTLTVFALMEDSFVRTTGNWPKRLWVTLLMDTFRMNLKRNIQMEVDVISVQSILFIFCFIFFRSSLYWCCWILIFLISLFTITHFCTRWTCSPPPYRWQTLSLAFSRCTSDSVNWKCG